MGKRIGLRIGTFQKETGDKLEYFVKVKGATPRLPVESTAVPIANYGFFPNARAYTAENPEAVAYWLVDAELEPQSIKGLILPRKEILYGLEREVVRVRPTSRKDIEMVRDEFDAEKERRRLRARYGGIFINTSNEMGKDGYHGKKTKVIVLDCGEDLPNDFEGLLQGIEQRYAISPDGSLTHRYEVTALTEIPHAWMFSDISELSKGGATIASTDSVVRLVDGKVWTRNNVSGIREALTLHSGKESVSSEVEMDVREYLS
jgi:hypothetical protein